MKRFGTLVPVAVAGALALVPARAGAQETDPVGTYFAWFDATAIAGDTQGVFIPAIVTLQAGGTVIAVDATDSGFVAMRDGGFPLQPSSITQGVWELVGKNTILWTAFYFGFDRETGAVAAINRLTGTFSFADDRTGEGFVCEDSITIRDGLFNPAMHNPAWQMRELECTLDFSGLVYPVTFIPVR